MSPQHRGRRHSRKPLEKWKDYFVVPVTGKLGLIMGRIAQMIDDDDDDDDDDNEDNYSN